MKRILTNWSILQQYFAEILGSCTQNERYQVNTILHMLQDEKLRLYFEFVYPIIISLETQNAFFQHEFTDPEDSYKELILYHKSVHARVYNHLGNPKHVSHVDFGSQFVESVTTYLRRSGPAMQTALTNEIDNIKIRCRDFLIELVKQLAMRLPENNRTVRDLSSFSVKRVLNQLEKVPFAQLPCRHLIPNGELHAVEEQYRRLTFNAWSEEDVFKHTDFTKITSSEFWAGLYNYRIDGTDEFPFRQLCSYVFSCFTIPLSSAQVERMFNLVTCVKTKYRNRMKMGTLESIVRIRAYMHQKKTCCNSYEIPAQMLNYFTSAIYITSNMSIDTGSTINTDRAQGESINDMAYRSDNDTNESMSDDDE